MLSLTRISTSNFGHKLADVTYGLGTSELLTAVLHEIKVFRVVTPCRLVTISDVSKDRNVLETSVAIYQST